MCFNACGNQNYRIKHAYNIDKHINTNAAVMMMQYYNNPCTGDIQNKHYNMKQNQLLYCITYINLSMYKLLYYVQMYQYKTNI